MQQNTLTLLEKLSLAKGAAPWGAALLSGLSQGREICTATLNKLVDKVTEYTEKISSGNGPLQSRDTANPDAPFNHLPPELLHLVLLHVEPDTLATAVPLVCRSWREAASSPMLWHGRLSSRALEQREAMAQLGPAVSAHHLWLALSGRNFLRNPGFLREHNSTLLELGRPAWTKWQRNAWVITSGTDDSVCWEAPPAGFLPTGPDDRPPAAALMVYDDSASTAVLLPAAPEPIPYGGGGIRLAAKVQARLGHAQQQLQSFLHGIAEGVAAVANGPNAPPSTSEVVNTSTASRSKSEVAVGTNVLSSTVEGGDGVVWANGSGKGQSREQEGEDGEGQTREEAASAGVQGVEAGRRGSCDGSGNGRGAPQGMASGCLATAEDWAEIVQVVDLEWELQRRGLSAQQAAQLLDAGLSLRLTVYIGCRWEVLGQYSVGLMLDEGLSGGAETEPKLHMFVERPSRHRFFSGRVRCSGTGGWERFECSVERCPKGFRRALVMLRGRVAPGGTLPAPLPLPRFSGTKFACAELVFS